MTRPHRPHRPQRHHPPKSGPSQAAAQSVRPLELFFDLVFVFAITQITSLLAEHPSGTGLVRVAVLLAVTWWMYGGYAWLTNALDLERTRPRLLLLAGTAAFFVMSLAVPRAFGPGPWGALFGASYLVVVLIHTLGFVGTSGHRGIARIGPFNLLGALIVLAAGLAPQGLRLELLALACVVLVAAPFITGTGGFTVGVGHFVERHGLAVIILLGESIVEVGTAATDLDDLATVVLGPLLALALSASLWWLYFDREERDSERLLGRVPAEQRPRLALYSFGYAYLVMIFGIAVTAVGMQEAVTSFTTPLHGLPAGLLALGMALFLVGLAYFHRTLAGSWSGTRLVGAVAVALTVPAARWVGGWLALVVALAVMVLLILRSRPVPEAG
ncbi:low temperature requirement protein A [Kitasatospora nipponensis]|uniref:low temperature requirement protein A n=1 Tax=Kitasatospora nipponensis TaxID=258049 RepID=UPI0031DCA205